MEKLELNKLRSLPIEEVAQRLGLEVSHHKALCPFHDDKHPSLSFHVGRNTYRCWSCGAHGDVIDLAMKLLNKDFKEACVILNGSPIEVKGQRSIVVGVSNPSPSGELERGHSSGETERGPFDASRYERFFEHPWLSPEACHFLFQERKLDPCVISRCRLNSYKDRNGVNWLQIPYYDQDGKLIGVQSRRIDGTPSQPRFRFPYGAHCSIYNLPILKRLRPGDDLYIAEGCSDCWALLSAGHKAIAIPSATLLKPGDLAPIRELGLTLKMYPDNDLPGERLFLQLQELALRSGLRLERMQLPPGCKDYSEYYLAQVTPTPFPSAKASSSRGRYSIFP